MLTIRVSAYSCRVACSYGWYHHTCLRLVSSGYANYNSGAVLGEQQWQWLEGVLRNSTADLIVVVSSIQVLTENPFVESWGHYPTEQQRLHNVLHQSAPATVIVSGDVHMGEAVVNKHSQPLEMTTSGLSHYCGSGSIPRWVCWTVASSFNHHQRAFDPVLAYNFGTLTAAETGRWQWELRNVTGDVQHKLVVDEGRRFGGWYTNQSTVMQDPTVLKVRFGALAIVATMVANGLCWMLCDRAKRTQEKDQKQD
eukprot:TRINITY_DN8167_c0_g1_i1.p1 TRINITY_DN8167_c0_g1~~TRINITY_DN8167_c0_g1_i1.p1  ORF type:complete len:253 (+),score=38.03 TRINITY_DN8167_c0_g1_i1:102-860(+)